MADRQVAIFSQRAIRTDVSRCSGYEFEDVIGELEPVHLIVGQRPAARETLYRARRWTAKRSGLFERIPSGTKAAPIGRDVDLFGCMIQKPVELLALDAVSDWQRRAKFSFCLLEELWWVNFEEYPALIKSLDKFDMIACAFESSCERVSKLTGRPAVHVPGAADLMRFMPEDLNRDRRIELYYMGRKRDALHAALQPMLRDRGAFYLYDSATRPPIAADHVVHRDLLASLINQSLLFMVDYGKLGSSDQASGQIIWGPRHVEGLAGGAVQVGYAPDSADYAQHFDWPEAVERLSENPAEAADQIARLLDAPAELARRRRINLAHAMEKHDWLHRWALILDHFGLSESPAMTARRAELAQRISTLTERRQAG
ncbi:MAG: glycosyltransferase [Pseudomonadota bacterium]